MISVSFIGKHASYVVLRVEQQLRTMSVCYIENDASLPVVLRVKQQLKRNLSLCYLNSCFSLCYASCNTGALLEHGLCNFKPCLACFYEFSNS